MEWTEGNIEGVCVTHPARYTDDRGWLSEIFRSDEMPEEILPAMAYLSLTHAGVTRGPHAHRHQTDTFAFTGPGTFRLKLWDNRPDSPTYGNTLEITAGENNPAVVSVPPGVVHGYCNISDGDALVYNAPNRLFAGKGKKDPVDEIRYEENGNETFKM
ncbi:MAG: dTDP-4-dehydrorhamnose 3,5-epimerase family protein [Kiritimatiellia bacterium]